MKQILYITLVLFSLTFNHSHAKHYQPAKHWRPIQDGTKPGALEIIPGSILDFSKIANTTKISSNSQRLIINKNGEIATKNNPNKPLRFLIGSWAYGPAEGMMPSKNSIHRLVQQYKMHGYNMVRIGHLEFTLMQNQKKDFDLNPVQLDRFYYLISELKNNGMYIIVEGLSSGNGGLGDKTIGGKPGERYLGHHHLNRKVYYDQHAINHWKKLVRVMYGKTNPYTNTKLLEDPVLAGFILSNENGIAFNLILEKSYGSNEYANELKPAFNNWLAKKYKNTVHLRKSWSHHNKAHQLNNHYKQLSKLRPYEAIEKKNVEIVDFKIASSPRMADMQKFFYEMEVNTAKWMTQYLRGLGYQGMITSYNNHRSPATHATRSRLEWIDTHDYFAHPSNYTTRGSKINQESLLENEATYVQWLAYTKQFNKPFTVSEHGAVFWNQYRREAGLMLPAYAALQKWAGICQHTQSVHLQYSKLPGKRNDAITPFSVGLDPISRATETLSALLYLRGDISPALHSIVAHFTDEDAFLNSDFETYPPRYVSRLSLITGLTINYLSNTPLAKRSNFTTSADAQLFINNPENLTVVKGGTPIRYYKKIHNTNIYSTDFVNETWEAQVNKLRKTGILTHENLTNPKRGIFHSDTGQIFLNKNQQLMSVITDKTEGITMNKPKPIKLNRLSVLSLDTKALISISAMEKKPNISLLNSKRMLMILSTDAQNSNMLFNDASSTTLHHLGTQPILIKPAKLKVALENSNSKELKVWAIDLRGKRVELIPVKRIKNKNNNYYKIEFEVNTHQLKTPTTYFEINTI